MFRKCTEMKSEVYAKCHGGQGDLTCRHVLHKADSEMGTQYMHDDILPPGVSIGEHRHDGDEEIYFLVEGSGTMILDGQEHPMGPGDVSVVKSGHTHGLINTGKTPMRLIVICTRKPG
jgi:mannose-6-phosphate isomerase-like protein (cupin superfamily)